MVLDFFTRGLNELGNNRLFELRNKVIKFVPQPVAQFQTDRIFYLDFSFVAVVVNSGRSASRILIGQLIAIFFLSHFGTAFYPLSFL
jgi:hypothetical protein